jgi:hypothetical protein
MSLEAAQERHRTAGRNDACPCGSGKKYKKCHQAEDDALIGAELRRLEAEAIAKAAAEAAAEAESEEGTDGDAKARPKTAQRPGGNSGGGGVSQRQGSSARAQNLPRRRAV